jgi:hypothetical protein
MDQNPGRMNLSFWKAYHFWILDFPAIFSFCFPGGLMIKRALFVLWFVLPLTAVGLEAQVSPEDVKTRLSKHEIIDLMVKMGRLTGAEQQSRLDAVLQDASRSKTPRSDFLLCAGLAYLGNHRAQACAGSAYENGRGVVEDLSDAYVWYALAQENASADETAKQAAQTAGNRVKMRLVSTYPSPSDEDLEGMVQEQRSRIVKYREEAKK